MTDRTPNHPAADIIAALESETMRVERAECADAGMPASDHPVVQRAARVLDAAHTRSTVTAAHLAIMTALEHLTADDLRDTPAGRALMAEAWEEGAEAAWASTAEGFNAECAFEHLAGGPFDGQETTFRESNPDTPNPYRAPAS